MDIIMDFRIANQALLACILPLTPTPQQPQRTSLHFTIRSNDAFVKPKMQLMSELLHIFERDYTISHTPN